VDPISVLGTFMGQKTDFTGLFPTEHFNTLYKKIPINKKSLGTHKIMKICDSLVESKWFILTGHKIYVQNIY
jgi:hypothetical protein